MQELERAADAFLRSPRGRGVWPMASESSCATRPSSCWRPSSARSRLPWRCAAPAEASPRADGGARPRLASRPHLSDEQRAHGASASHGTATASPSSSGRRAPARRPPSPRRERHGKRGHVRSEAARSRARPPTSSADRRHATPRASRRLLRQPRPLEPGTVLVIDEASMLGTRACASCSNGSTPRAASSSIAGDTSQLPRSRPAACFGALASRLDRDRAARQPPPGAGLGTRRASSCCATATGEAALALYERHGRLHIGSDAHEVLEPTRRRLAHHRRPRRLRDDRPLPSRRPRTQRPRPRRHAHRRPARRRRARRRREPLRRRRPDRHQAQQRPTRRPQQRARRRRRASTSAPASLSRPRRRPRRRARREVPRQHDPRRPARRSSTAMR